MAKAKPAANTKSPAKATAKPATNAKPVAKAKPAARAKAPVKAPAKTSPPASKAPATAPAQAATRRSGVPEGQQSLTPHLVVRGAADAIAFYQRAFGAEEVMRMPGPDGRMVLHANLRIGGSHLYLADEFPGMGGKAPPSLGGSPVTLHLYVENADAVFEQAVAAGARVKVPLSNMFWGDRYGQLIDPFGHEWSIATHMEDVAPEEMKKRQAEAFAHMASPPP
jgi:uncharacterized glyoxalase superfamily protein PhnB